MWIKIKLIIALECAVIGRLTTGRYCHSRRSARCYSNSDRFGCRREMETVAPSKCDSLGSRSKSVCPLVRILGPDSSPGSPQDSPADSPEGSLTDSSTGFTSRFTSRSYRFPSIYTDPRSFYQDKMIAGIGNQLPVVTTTSHRPTLSSTE